MFERAVEKRKVAFIWKVQSPERKALVCAESIIVVLLFMLSASLVICTNKVAADTWDDYTYTVTDGLATITKYNGAGGDVTIPSRLGPDPGYPVVAIGSNAFWNCTALESVTIPSSVAIIGAGAFSDCHALTAIDVEQSNPNYASIDGVLYDKHITTLIKCPEGKAGVIIIPDSVTTIGEWAFLRCHALKSVTIPDSVTTIRRFAFWDCTALKSVTIPNSVTAIDRAAFGFCTSLKWVTISGGVTYIGDEAFSFCYALKWVSIETGVTAIGDCAFGWCHALKSVTIPSSVTFIGGGAFHLCYALTEIEVDQDNPNYASIDGVLYDKHITTLMKYPAGKAGVIFTIPDSVAEIGRTAFWDCTALKSVTIPNSVITIGDWAFSYCSGLKSVTIGGGVATIGDYAFYRCTALTSVSFQGLSAPSSVGYMWVSSTSPRIQGHASAASNFPAPGECFYGLLMGEYLPSP